MLADYSCVNGIIDLEFDNNNNLFVLEHRTNSILSNDPSGSLIKIFPDGRRQTLLSAGDGLIFPTGLAVGQDGYIYIANNIGETRCPNRNILSHWIYAINISAPKRKGKPC